MTCFTHLYVVLCVLTLPVYVVSNGFISFYNDRYGDLFIDYNAEDATNGIWATTGDYLDIPDAATGDSVDTIHMGCSYAVATLNLSSCTGSVYINTLSITNITKGALEPSVTSLQIYNCPKFELFEEGTFENLTSLSYVKIQNTALNHVPDLSQTSLRLLNLVGNRVAMDTATHFGWTMPISIQYIALMQNRIYWIPPGMISGPALRMVSFGDNQLPELNPNIFGDTSSLIYFGAENNRISRISKNTLAPLASANFRHLNLSNNALSFVQPQSFSQLSNLVVLELHGNSFTTVQWDVFHNMPNLAHLDLHKNAIANLPTKSFENLPKLRELRLHSQTNPMRSIAYDAWRNIGAELKVLYVGDNALTTFPHQVLEEGSYPNLVEIYADNNQIYNITEYGSEAFHVSQNAIWKSKSRSFKPFSTYPNLLTLMLDNNVIKYINNTDLCNIPKLLFLYLSGNNIREAYMDIDAFACVPKMIFLRLNYNDIQYVPDTLKLSAMVPALATLYMRGNKLTFIEQHAFSDVTSLRTLDLSLNRIVTIENEAFPSQINSLNVSHNNFRFSHDNPFSNLSSMTDLNLWNNEIDYLPPTAFHGCTNLNTLALDHNNIPQLLSSHFRDCRLSDEVNLGNNDIGYIEDGTFAHKSSYGTINLYNNKITRLPSNDFQSKTIHRLNLANNRITVISANAFKDLTISDNEIGLSLSNNYITLIEANAFNNVSLGLLNIGGNSVRYIEPYAFNTVRVSGDITLEGSYLTNIPTHAFYEVTISSTGKLNLKSNLISNIESEGFYSLISYDMDLSANQLTSISESIFGGTSRVASDFFLNGNGLSMLSTNAFDNMDLNRVSLNNNGLTVFPAALTFQVVTYIHLGQNQITEIPDGSLDNQPTLAELYLSDNQLTSLPSGLFDDLTALRILDLSRNDIVRLPTGLLDNVTRLETLYLNGNNLTHFDALTNHNQLATINLQSNELETVSYMAFSSLADLSSVVLSDNNIECTCQLLETLQDVGGTVSSGTCASPSALSGVSLVTSSTNYYGNSTFVNATYLQCTAANATGALISSKSFSISWISPSSQFLETDPSLASTPLNGTVTFTVTCTTSTGAATLTKTETDTIYSINGTSSYTVTFVEADGVVPGTTYECSITMEMNGSISAKGEPVFLTTADDIATPATPGPNDVVLDIIYYDFSRIHVDFQDVNYVTVTNPTYVPSPYGSWLAASTTPTADTFSTWYRYDIVGNNNFELNDTLILAHQADSSKLFWSDSFFPVDGKGYTSESQQDCSGTYHNFGFTSALRAGLVYAGTETITVGGGDALWLYINKVEMFEFRADGSGNISCYVLDLSTASSPGGYVIPQVGTLSGGSCTSLVTASYNVSLALEVGVTYHFNVFHAETRLCSSEFLLHVSGTTLSDDFNTYAPVDYDIAFNEDSQVGEIVTEVFLSDDFSVGSYELVLYSGNEARQFEVVDNTYTFTPAVVVVNYTNMTDIQGNPFAFVECTTSSPTASTTNDLTAESFTISVTSVKISLKALIDYESVTSYILRMTVVDSGRSLTGTIAVRVAVQDVNDNCPQVTPTSVTLSPEPVLRLEPFATFTTTDADSGENANVYFIVSEISEDPAVNFDDSYDLWGDVYLRYTSLNFFVIAIDNGTIQRGSRVSVSVNVSNTCVTDVLFGKIWYMFYVDNSTGEMTYRVPKYWMYEFTCSDLIGLVSGHVLDYMLSASSSMDSYSGPGRARLNQTEDTYSQMLGGWVAATFDNTQYIEVDMNMDYKFTKLFIQGRADADQWVTSFKLLYYNSTTLTWETYANSVGVETFTGNSDRTTIVTYDLDPPLLSRYVRLNPQTWDGGISLRFEMSGCPQAEQLFYDVSCQRCETSYYCEGDGTRSMCGRCNDTSVTCNRNPAEHSYGLASECTSCPAGRICQNGTAYICDPFYYVECTNTSCPSTCSPCEPGYVCKDGIRTLCAAGTYSDGQMEFCTSCLPGTYQNLTGQSSCLPCDAGYFSVTGMSQCDVCTNDKYSLNDGTGCHACADSTQCPCIDGTKCHSKSLCYNTGNGGYACLPCGDGLTGDGVTCADTDECYVYDPCFQSRCVNTNPGFQCLECPDGYTGTYEDALAYTIKHRVFLYTNTERSNYTYQTCEDIDECATNYGGCDPLMTCVNTPGSYYCDFCATGYMGTNRTGCYLDDFCRSGSHTCDTTRADCVYLGPAQFRCKCKPGYAGTGTLCGLDTDLDGRPDIGLPCTDSSCQRDNCGSIPNSYQEDNDGDNLGDNCDADDDNDGRYDSLDNCKFVSNFNQTDSNSDGVGDVCSTDGDGDGIDDAIDNCPLVANSGQSDGDGDSIGDGCDNCPTTSNINQDDVNGNSVGDACESVTWINIDEDGDGILDGVDNCPSYMNGDQSDTDSDGIGDLCDDDIDNDGVNNDNDNCDYVSNSNQADVDGNGVGDACEGDTDGDGVNDESDSCPYNRLRQSTSFSNHFTVRLDPSSTSDPPNWVVKADGSEVQQTVSTDMPIMLIGSDSYGSVEYAGTWYTSDTTASDYFGFVFGYVRSSKFYIVMWRGQHYNYRDLDQSTYKAGIQGPQIKLVDSTSGPSSALAQALWHSDDTTNHVTVLWQDPSLTTWSPATSYRWYLTHTPTNGYINLKIYDGTSLLVDSGSLYDYSISGGRLGVFQFGAFPMIWSHLEANCLDHSNKGLYLDGVDDFVTLSEVTTIHMDFSFTIEAWIKLDSGFTSGPYPITCTLDTNICFWVEGGVLKGKYGTVTVTGTSSLSGGSWHNVIFRHSLSSQKISLFVDGTLDNQGSVSGILNWTSVASANQTMYIGKDNTAYFRGTIDEVRFYNVAILDSEISSHISLPSLQRETLKQYGAVHFRMEELYYATSLTNSGYLSSQTAQLSGGSFVTSYQQYKQFQMAFPNN